MLNNSISPRQRQQGVTLMIALIVLVVMTLAGIALVRSVDSTNIIAGNLAFQQAATHSGDRGIEAAVSWLEQNNSAAALDNDQNTVLSGCNGYTASRVDPAPGVNWDTWWNALSTCQKAPLLPQQDAAGNTVTYTIHRMCSTSGPAATPGTGCSVSAITVVGGSTSSQTAGYRALQYSGQVYYRITSRIDGPRGTKSYVQAIAAI
jgi:Tfp pilus assembly protein PilX